MDYYSSLFASKLNGGGGGGGGGITPAIKTALLACFSKVAWVDENGQDYYDTLLNALYSPADLSSITAVYTQSVTVTTATPLDDLKTDLVVTANWSDSSTSTVGGEYYTLSGTLTVGTSAVTVTYLGKTTTFNVTVTEAAFYPITLTDTSDGVGFGSYDSTKPTSYLGNTNKSRIHLMGTNCMGYPVTYGKSYTVTATSQGTAKIAFNIFNANGKSGIENLQSVTSDRTDTGWLTFTNNTITYTPTQVNGSDPVMMWIVFSGVSPSSWTSLTEMTPITITENP